MSKSVNREGKEEKGKESWEERWLDGWYREVATEREVTRGRLVREVGKGEGDEEVNLGVEYKVVQRDCTRKCRREYGEEMMVKVVGDKVMGGGQESGSRVPREVTGVQEATSPTGEYQLLLRQLSNDPNHTGQPGRYVELYRAGRLLLNLDVTSLHQEFYGDNTFGKVRFSRGGTKVVYIAERKLEEGTEKGEKGDRGVGLVVEDESEKYQYNQEWGETFINRRRPTLFVVHLDRALVMETGQLHSSFDYSLKELITPIVFESTTESVSIDFDPGQACFHPQEEGTLLFTGYHKLPIKHGLVYCWNRPASLYSVQLDGSHLKLISDPTYSSRTPQFLLPTSDPILFYFRSAVGGAHASGSQFIKLDLTTREETILIDLVKDHTDPEVFPGLYPDYLSPHHLKVSDQEFTVITSQWRSRKVLLGVNLEIQEGGPSSQLSLISEGWNEAGFSWNLLDTRDHYVLASRSSPNLPCELLLGLASLDDSQRGLKVDWHSLKKFSPINDYQGVGLDELKWEVFSLTEWDPRLECILIKAVRPHPNLIKKTSLVLNLHGGPHSGNIVTWSHMNAALAYLGFDVLHVNYSGSTGYGDDYVQRLVGHVGDRDVKDCQYAMESVWNRGDYHRKFVMGGSHGGFLTAHLIGQYPDYYHGCALRNPVTNIGAMSFVSDIPDWCFAEAGLPYSFSHPTPTTPAYYETMYNASPYQYTPHLQTPILLLLGSDDRRVPPSQGLHWYRQVKAHHPDLISLKLIPDVGHPLDTIPAEYISLLQIGKLFLDHLD